MKQFSDKHVSNNLEKKNPPEFPAPCDPKGAKRCSQRHSGFTPFCFLRGRGGSSPKSTLRFHQTCARNPQNAAFSLGQSSNTIELPSANQSWPARKSTICSWFSIFPPLVIVFISSQMFHMVFPFKYEFLRVFPAMFHVRWSNMIQHPAPRLRGTHSGCEKIAAVLQKEPTWYYHHPCIYIYI